MTVVGVKDADDIDNSYCLSLSLDESVTCDCLSGVIGGSRLSDCATMAESLRHTPSPSLSVDPIKSHGAQKGAVVHPEAVPENITHSGRLFALRD